MEQKDSHSREYKIQRCEQPENTIQKNIQDQNNVLMEQWRTDDKTFVSTRAAVEVLKRIRNDISVIVSGNSGVGKTVTMRHVALLLKNDGFRIIPTTNPKDLRWFSQKGVKTLFVIDDICGQFTLKEQQVDTWEAILSQIQPFLEHNQCKIIATCRLQVFKDIKFKTLTLFNRSECNLNSEEIKLTKEEKSRLADVYLKERADDVKDFSDEFDCFPLLCKLYRESNFNNIDINNFFNNPYQFYRNELDCLQKENDGGKLKYCCLVLCVIFNNRINEDLLKSIGTNDQSLIEETFNACKLNKGTSVELLRDSLQTLENTFLTKINGTYKTIHDKIFDILARIVGRNHLSLCIKYCGSEFIRERFTLNPTNTSDSETDLSIYLGNENVDMYIERMIQDWSDGLVVSVFGNKNMKNEIFIDNLIKRLNKLEASEKEALAHKKDNENKEMSLLLSSFIGNVFLTEWILKNTCHVGKKRNSKGLTSRSNRKGYIHPDINIQRQNGTTSFYIACENGYFQLMKKLSEYGADATFKKTTGDSCLSVACENGHTDIVQELLANSDINKDYQNKTGYTSLYFACQNGHENIVQILLQYKVDASLCSKLECSPLFVASENGHHSIVKQLLKYGANVIIQNTAGQVPLHTACQNNHIDVVRMLLDADSTCKSVNTLDQKGLSPLYVACQCLKGHFKVMELLLQHNADVNKGRPPLILTSENGNTEMSKALIERKAQINSCVDDWVSPLFVACRNSHFETVCFLLKSGADPNVCRGNGASPLIIASQNGNVDIVKELLLNKCNVNKSTTDGTSSLYLASQNGHFGVVCQLIEAGANLNTTDSDGKTALFKASQNGHLEIVSTLLNSTADVNLCTTNNVTPADIAKKNNHSDIVSVLEKHNQETTTYL